VVRDARQGGEIARRPVHQRAADVEPGLSGDQPGERGPGEWRTRGPGCRGATGLRHLRRLPALL
jgi:hypothetical protein